MSQSIEPIATTDATGRCVDGAQHGAQSENGHIRGAYLHGLFTSDAFRQDYMTRIGAAASDQNYFGNTEAVLDELADHLEKHLDLDALLEIAS